MPLAQKSATVPLVTHSPDTAVIKWIHYLWLCISSLLGITAFKMKKKRIVAFTKNLLCNWQKVTKGLLRKAARHIVLDGTINHLITVECNTNGQIVQDIWLRLACYLGSEDIFDRSIGGCSKCHVTRLPNQKCKWFSKFFQMHCCRNVQKSVETQHN